MIFTGKKFPIFFQEFFFNFFGKNFRISNKYNFGIFLIYFRAEKSSVILFGKKMFQIFFREKISIYFWKKSFESFFRKKTPIFYGKKISISNKYNFGVFSEKKNFDLFYQICFWEKSFQFS
jgi:hypothetical protein